MKITDAQRRARLTRTQLSTLTETEDVVSALLALHATDPASVYLSVLARSRKITFDDIRASMYKRRSLVRMMAMRRTMFVIATDDVPLVHAAASVGVARTMRARLKTQVTKLPTEPVVDDVDTWLAELERETLEALRNAGTATGAELSAAVPGLRTALLPTTDKVYDVKQNVTSQVLVMLAAEGHMVRTEPRGAWTSRHHTWAPMELWLPGGVAELDEAAAREELARRWLQVFGPATFDDLQWWTGWNKTQTRIALSTLDTVDVELQEGDGIMLADTHFPRKKPGTVLLPSLDPTPMGWKRRAWYLGDHGPKLFDTFGNIGPTIWSDGRIVGGWSVSSSGEVLTELFEDIGTDATAAVDIETERLTTLLDGTPIVPSFPTPTEKRLRGRP
ncbi:winged helix DNA-binding domain-containing protein [Actinomycetes bacterium M1A6_2h]